MSSRRCSKTRCSPGNAILRDRDIDFDVHNGVVTVKGEVRTAEEKNKVTELVRAAPDWCAQRRA
jgi:BON domain-containing protein